MKSASESPEWIVLLDLGEESRATQIDALYLESALQEAGVRTVFYPWHPSQDVFTPLGATRPLQLLVDREHVHDGRELLRDILEGRPESSDVVVPVADAWVRRHYIGIVLSHLRQRARDRGRFWRVLDVVIRIGVALLLVAAAIAAALGAVSALRSLTNQ